MDNFKLDITCRGKEAFQKAMALAFHNHTKAEAIRVDPKKGLIFYWHAEAGREALSAGYTKLIFKHDANAATDLAWNWLLNVPDEEYQEYLDLDGSLTKGWRVYNQQWGKIEGEGDYSFVAIQPVWAWMGK